MKPFPGTEGLFSTHSLMRDTMPGQFGPAHQAELDRLYAEAKFIGRPPKGTKKLSRLVKRGHFPWLATTTPQWQINLNKGGPAYETYVRDLRINALGTDKSAAGRKSGEARRTNRDAILKPILEGYMCAKVNRRKPVARQVAKWHIAEAYPDLDEIKQLKKIRSLTKSLRQAELAS